MKIAASLALLLLVSGCATVSGPTSPKDPWEGYNRGMFEVNDKLDRAVLKPVAQGYETITPVFVRAGLNNFFENLYDVGTGLNNLLQGKPAQGAGDLARFAVNSVIGIFGLWDVATPMGLEKHEEDFGQTLAVWGVPSGPYFIIPLLGPSTVRDAPARYVDPSVAYYGSIGDVATRYGFYGVDVVRNRANLLKAEKVLDEAALDKYLFVRDSWLQRRRNQIYDGNPPREPEDE